MCFVNCFLPTLFILLCCFCTVQTCGVRAVALCNCPYVYPQVNAQQLFQVVRMLKCVVCNTGVLLQLCCTACCFSFACLTIINIAHKHALSSTFTQLLFLKSIPKWDPNRYHYHCSASNLSCAGINLPSSRYSLCH